METAHIKLTRDLVIETSTYKNLNHIAQKMARSRNNIVAIENSVNIIRNRGFDLWESQTNCSYRNKLIIMEIIG